MAKKKFSATGFVLKATLLIAVSICIIMIIKNNGNSEGYIGKSGFTGEDRLTPELMLTLGRVSSPQLSPDGTHGYESPDRILFLVRHLRWRCGTLSSHLP